MTHFLLFSVLLSALGQAEAASLTAIGADGKQIPSHSWKERERLRRFVGLRKKPRSAVVYQDAPVVHHHMLNHQVSHALGPMLKPFSEIRHKRVSSNASAPGAFHAVAQPGYEQPDNLKLAKGADKGKSNGADKANDAGKKQAAAPAPAPAAAAADPIKTMRAEKCIAMLKEHGLEFSEENKGKCVTFMVDECVKPIDENWKGMCNEWDDLLANPPAPEPAAPGGIASGTYNQENEKLPEQGYTGELVAHDNMKTATADWRTEYGPHSYKDICAKYPNNEWCRLHGHHGTTQAPKESPPQSGIRSTLVVAGILVMICMCLAALSRAN